MQIDCIQMMHKEKVNDFPPPAPSGASKVTSFNGLVGILSSFFLSPQRHTNVCLHTHIGFKKKKYYAQFYNLIFFHIAAYQGPVSRSVHNCLIVLFYFVFWQLPNISLNIIHSVISLLMAIALIFGLLSQRIYWIFKILIDSVSFQKGCSSS